MDYKPRIIYFTSRDEVIRVDLTSVAYFEAEGNYTKMVSFNGIKTYVLMNLGQMEKLLALRFKDAPGTFARVGKRFIVNLHYVYQVNTLEQKLTLSDQRTFRFDLDISKVALKALKELIAPNPKSDNPSK